MILTWTHCPKKTIRVRQKYEKAPSIAKVHIHKGSKLCHVIVYSDESKFMYCYCIWKWWKTICTKFFQQKIESKYTNKLVKHGDASIMVCSCFIASGLGLLEKKKRIMDGEVYIDILTNNLCGEYAWCPMLKKKKKGNKEKEEEKRDANNFPLEWNSTN